MSIARRADHGEPLGDDDEIADAILRQLEARAGFGTRQYELDARNRRDAALRIVAHRGHRQIHGRIRSERAVMNDVGIGDRQDDARRAGAVPRIERVLQKHDVGPSERIRFRVHPVVGGKDNGCAQHVELPQARVEHAGKRIRGGRPRCMLVLHVVGCRQIHDVGPLAFHQRHARVEHELR